MRLVLLFLAGFFTLATLIPLIRRDHWTIRIFDFPRAQIFVLGFIVWMVYLTGWGFSDTASVVVFTSLALALAWQVYNILPYTALHRPQVRQERHPNETLSLVVANVLMSNDRYDRFIEIVRAADPDLILTLEPDNNWEAALQPLEADYPYTIKCPLDNRYGMLFYSRLPFRDPEIKYLLMDEIPSIHVILRTPSGNEVSFHGIHPEPPSPTEADDSTKRDAELLLVAQSVKDAPLPVVVTGDFNDVAWSYTTRLFQKTSGLLDPRIGRGMYNTFHAQVPFLRFPLDHLFHSDDFRLVTLRRLPKFGSDHFAFFVSLCIDPCNDNGDDPPELDQEEAEFVEEKIARGGPQDEVPEDA